MGYDFEDTKKGGLKGVPGDAYRSITNPTQQMSKDATKFADVFGLGKPELPGRTSGIGIRGPKSREYDLAMAGIDPTEINQQAALAGEQQRQGNVSAYNAAIASQRGVNPTAAAMSMGQNLSSMNAQTGANVQNLQAQNSWQAQQANQQAILNMYGQQMGQNTAAYQAQMGQATTERGQDITANTANKATNANIFGSIMGGAGGVVGGIGAMFSDERAKQPVDYGSHLHEHLMGRAGQKEEMQESGKQSTEQFMSSLKPNEFEYKPGTIADDDGKPHTGVMAQDLEKTPSGASAVMDTPDGKMVDVKQLAAMLAASVGDLHMRLSHLEGRGKQNG